MADPEPKDYTVQYGGTSALLRRWVWLPNGDQPTVARMRIQVLETSQNLPTQLFVWERHTVFSDGASENRDRVMCVAKPGDLNVYPVDEPDTTGKVLPFYRSDLFDVVFNDVDDFVMTWNDILADIAKLIENIVEMGLIDEPIGS